MNKKAIGYVRLSNKNQKESVDDIQKQKDLIKSWISLEEVKSGHKIDLEIIEDVAVSGRKATRNGLKNLIGKLKNERFDYFVVRDFARLSRDTYFSLEFFESVIKKYNVNFVSITECIDTSTPNGRFMFTVLVAMGQLYSENISEKIIDAISKKRSMGLAIGGTIPYGFTKDDQGRLIEVEKEQEVIKLITKLKTDGRSYNDIRQTLLQMRIESPDGKYWHTGTIRRLHLSYLKNNRLAS